MVRWGWPVPFGLAVLAMPGCSLLIDSDVGVRGDAGAQVRDDGAAGGDATADARDCPVLPGLPPFVDDFSTGDLDWEIDPRSSAMVPARSRSVSKQTRSTSLQAPTAATTPG